MTGELIEFLDTPELRDKLAAFIGKECVIATPDITAATTPALLELDCKRYRHRLAEAAHKLILLLAANARPVLDLDLQARCESAFAAVSTHKPTRAIVAKWARVPESAILDFGHDAESFRARGGRYIEAIGIWILTADTIMH